MSPVDWNDFQKCPACAAEIGQACTTLSGVAYSKPVRVDADQPHGGRKLRAGAVSL